MDDVLYSPRKAAEALGMSVGTLSVYRSTAKGPAFERDENGKPVYRLSALLDFAGRTGRTVANINTQGGV